MPRERVATVWRDYLFFGLNLARAELVQKKPLHETKTTRHYALCEQYSYIRAADGGTSRAETARNRKAEDPLQVLITESRRGARLFGRRGAGSTFPPP